MRLGSLAASWYSWIQLSDFWKEGIGAEPGSWLASMSESLVSPSGTREAVLKGVAWDACESGTGECGRSREVGGAVGSGDGGGNFGGGAGTLGALGVSVIVGREMLRS